MLVTEDENLTVNSKIVVVNYMSRLIQRAETVFMRLLVPFSTLSSLPRLKTGLMPGDCHDFNDDDDDDARGRPMVNFGALLVSCLGYTLRRC